MFDSNFFEIDIPTLVVLFSVLLTLVLQLLLCFKAQKTLVKLLPVALLTIAAIVLYIISINVGGWDALGYLFFVILSFGLLVVCGLCWGVWAITRKSKP